MSIDEEGAIIYSRQPPQISDAPAWANWLAQDEDGGWTWFKHRPYYDSWPGMCGAWMVADEYDGDDDEYMETHIHTMPPLKPEEAITEIKR